MRRTEVVRVVMLAAIMAGVHPSAMAQALQTTPAAGERAQASVTASAETSPDQSGQPATRAGAIEQEQAEKAKNLHPYVLTKPQRLMLRFEAVLANEKPTLHPFLESAYHSGGFALGMGFMHHVSPFNTLDVRGSYSVKNYKRAEVEFLAPRLFQRRGSLTMLGGWREATQVPFYGRGPDSSRNNRLDYGFQEPHASALLTVFPTRRVLMFRGGVEYARWKLQRADGGRFPSIETVFSSSALPGVLTNTTYLHSQGTVGIDFRTSPEYSRRGGFYAVTAHDYSDRDNVYGFRQVDYEAIQHIPFLREAWVISLRGRLQTTYGKDGERVPFFMLPYLGGSSSLRGYTSLRFRDENSLLLQAEWRIMANRYLDSSFFYDTGKVAARRADLDFDGMKHDYGFGIRIHSPFATALRIEVARSNERTVLVFATGAAF